MRDFNFQLGACIEPQEAGQRIFDHVSDELLSQDSVGVLEEPELGQVEEHLLICEQCRARLTEFDDTWGLNG